MSRIYRAYLLWQRRNLRAANNICGPFVFCGEVYIPADFKIINHNLLLRLEVKRTRAMIWMTLNKIQTYKQRASA